jgi:cytochrome c-type biogenesis protein CcmH/NrfG
VGIAGVVFGFLVGWIIGDQKGTSARVGAPVAAVTPQGNGTAPAAPPVDESRASAMKATAQQNPGDAATRVQLGNMYFDAGRFPEAVEWYEAALKVQPKDVNASTDLGIAYYYMNQPDKALQQFDRSLTIEPKHAKTLLNIGIVRAFGKQDLKGASEAWQRVLAAAPGSDEARAAQQALEGVKAAHPEIDKK